ncbi:E3 ubiquitin-protein ligase TRIM38-like isoform X2 [Erinaceus europaeus]|uniref:E3 ubiquitin-protein ligase TRIM38-like isoform X2 n=1 Tax=Erinaceus europaeus TaxID=9365 RepID=A0ABM3X8U9_ERIEU|nr:E3 ubiquitin-protein ligase TRIM38-like isoform X2 [Erinaceus europaeus]
MREETKCSICLQLMTEAVNFDCGHSFCHLCLKNILKKCYFSEMTLKKYCCPQCEAVFQKVSLQQNKQLENLTEAIKGIDLEKCKKHGEELQLFCVDDEQLICWCCEWMSQHRGHVTALVEDICQDYKEKIELRKQKIHSEFEKLHNFLHEEEKSYLWRLEKEKEQTLRKLWDNEANLEKQSHELKNCILELEERCQASAHKLLQDVKDTLIRSSAVNLELPEPISVELHPLCNVSELYFDVKKMLRRYQATVTLDPDTVHNKLVLSKYQDQAAHRSKMEKLKNLKRFRVLRSVLGCKGFTSGRHYFEVDVGEGSRWDIGVCLKNVQRDISMEVEPSTGFWAIRLYKENHYVALTSPQTPLPLREKPLVVGIFLDYEAGLVSFYNMSTGSHIFTFPQNSFTETLKPYFCFFRCSPLFMLPPGE